MPLVHSFGIINSAVEARYEVLGKSNQCLDGQKTVSYQPKLSMHTRKMRSLMREFIVLDNDKRRNQRIDSEEVEGEMCQCALTLLGLCMRWLEDEDCLGGEENGGGVEERGEGEEAEWVQEYRCPD